MWKLAVGFAVFAAISLFVIFQAGDKVDMSGRSTGPRPLPRRWRAPAPSTDDLAQALALSDCLAGAGLDWFTCLLADSDSPATSP